MNITELRRSSAAVILGTASNAAAVGGVAISSNGIATAGAVLVATGSNSAIWRDAISFGSNTNDVSSVGTMGASASNSRADHVHRGVGAITAAGSNALYGTVNLAAGTGVALTAAGNTITVASTAAVSAGTYVEARNGGSEVVATYTAGATQTLNLASGNWFDVTLTANCTFTFSGATNNEGDSFVLILRENATGGWTATWPASVIWPGGSAPTQTTTASHVAMYTFLTRDGGATWYGFIAGTGSSVASPSFASNSFAEVSITADASLAITAPSSAELHFSAPFVNEVVTDAGDLVWYGADLVHSLVRLY